MPLIPDISTNDFFYELPLEKIAYYPSNERDNSKLLVFKEGIITETLFNSLPDLIDSNSIIVFNDTKVIPARLIFKKNTGAIIEIFCVEPHHCFSNYEQALKSEGEVYWRCLVGNKKRWKKNTLEAYANYKNTKITLKADFVEDFNEYTVVSFKWDDKNLQFNHILKLFGQTPLPPYIQRQPIEQDKLRYQTVYANRAGSVAAPTAGLHFTPELMNKLKNNGLNIVYLTLHITTGTFRPVTAKNISEHVMHNEQINIPKDTIEQLFLFSDKNIIAIGTTSVRSLESIYWFGAMIINNKSFKEFKIPQWLPYEQCKLNISRKEALMAVLNFMHNKNINILNGITELIIVPGYQYKMVDAMITNFHQPNSTLLMLVAAFINGKWREVYDYALKNNFRFLSYGDACLLFPYN
ncbi:MAG TPA: S-adenosylmethionine:tRNA ribosyltransferase-isomerase [Bacteroidales bacterium]|nr:S-adenosylmethionine:tRNA ribosyltransferase-isomerase [Bacteroidales bacterium]